MLIAAALNSSPAVSHAFRYAYLHGFASSPSSRKGRALAEIFERRGLPFERPDLNQPSFGQLSHRAMLSSVDEMDASAAARNGKWCFIGSSLGGWLAARWSELHPDRVDRLVLLCPGFDLASRWPAIVGQQGMEQWERDGALEMVDAAGEPVPVHWAFIEEARRQPAWPETPCPTLLIHGRKDETVPVEGSRKYAADRDHVTLLELDDDHLLAQSIDRIAEEVIRFFEL